MYIGRTCEARRHEKRLNEYTTLWC